MNKNMVLIRFLLSGILLLAAMTLVSAQEKLKTPPRRSENLIDVGGAYLKIIYPFSPEKLDTIPQPGPDPILRAKYKETDLVPQIFNAVFNGQVTVYDPNFWGTIPQLLEKQSHKNFDTLKILQYLSAGWDTSLMIENDGSVKSIPEYKKIPYDEISGLFFYESWWLDSKTSEMYKDVIAYIPIREYINTVYDGYEESEVRRRLLFMVMPEWSSGAQKHIKYKSRDFRIIRKDHMYKVSLYNRAYEQYLYRDEEFGEVSQSEFNEWQYHRFDFYRYFDPDLFLEKIISGVLQGKNKAYSTGPQKEPLNPEEFRKLLFNNPGNTIEWDELSNDPQERYPSESDLLPENYPVSELNSITFHEDWYFNPENLQIYKNVKGITINRTESEFDKYTGEFIRGSENPLFTIWF